MPVEPVELIKLIIGLIILTIPGYLWSFLFSKHLTRPERLVFGFLSGLGLLTITTFLLNMLFTIKITQALTWILYALYIIPIILLYILAIHRYELPKLTLNHIINMKFMLLIIILCLAFLITFLPHLSNNYYLPFHVDEWEHWRYTQGFIDNGSISFTNPYTGSGLTAHAEIGFHIATACIYWISGSNLLTIFVFLPALLAIVFSLTAFSIGERSQRKFGLEAAFLIMFIPTAVRYLGPSFYVASTLSLLFILFLIWLAQLKKIQAAVLIPAIIFCIFLIHPTTALAGIGIILVYAIFLAVEKEYRLALLTGVLTVLPIILIVFFTTRWNSIVDYFITSISGQSYLLDLGLPKIWVSFFDLGILTWALLIVGVYFSFIKGTSLLKTLSISAIAFVIVIGLYDKFGYGFPSIYERMFLYLFLVVVLIAGFGLSEIRRLLTDLAEKKTFKQNRLGLKNLKVMLPVVLCIVILFIAVPVHLNTLYYTMINEQEYETFTWIHDHISEYRDANHSYTRAAVDPFKASPFSVVTGLYTISSNMSPLYGYELHTQMETFLQNRCVNTSFLDTHQLSVIYGEATNSNLTKIHDHVYLYTGLPKK